MTKTSRVLRLTVMAVFLLAVTAGIAFSHVITSYSIHYTKLYER